jgi:uncharacterized membrane protein HdeD (DUF308 family)
VTERPGYTASPVVGVLVATCGHWLVGDPLLAGTLAVVYGDAVALSVFVVRRHAALGLGEWDRRWTAAGTAVVLVGSVGIHYGLSMGTDLTVALQALALGIGYDGVLVGAGTVLAGVDDGE